MSWQAAEVKKRLKPQSFSLTKASNSFLSSSRSWLFDGFQSWLGDASSRIFWLTGVAGTGKTAFAEELLRRHEASFAAHFFFKHNTKLKSDLVGMLTTVAFQLAQAHCSDGRQLQKGVAELGGDDLHTYELEDLLEHLLETPLGVGSRPGQGKVVVLLDALDECKRFKGQDISKVLAGWMNRLPAHVCFLLTSRPEEDILDDLRAFNPLQIDTQSGRNATDLPPTCSASCGTGSAAECPARRWASPSAASWRSAGGCSCTP